MLVQSFEYVHVLCIPICHFKVFEYCTKDAAVYLITVWISVQGLHKICRSLQEDLLQRTVFMTLTS